MVEPVAAALQGLTPDQAAQALARDGPNELPGPPPRRTWRLLIEVFEEPMLLLLLACGGVYLLLGERGDAALLLAAVAVVVLITLVQEQRTENAVSALRELAAPLATVLRGGERVRVPARALVRGDVLVLGEGERVAADAKLLQGTDVQADESLLSGESVPVAKLVGAVGTAGQVFAGTLVTRGRGLAEVTATGARCELGRIGASLATTPQPPTPLQQESARLVLRIGLLAAAVCALVVVWMGLARGDWLAALLAGIALAMGLLPEEVPVVITVFLALGSLRLARQRVLTRRMASLEALGAASLLCVDKTGTLTLNRMRVLALQPVPGVSESDLIRCAQAASPRQPFDPMERAIVELQAGGDDPLAGWAPIREYALASTLLAVTRVWQASDGQQRRAAAKGAPEAIAQLCRLDATAQAALQVQVEALAAQGLRVLGVARARTQRNGQPLAAGSDTADGQAAHDFQFTGLLGLADPLREGVPAALAECRRAGVRVMMITGDHPATALAIARQAGFGAAPRLLSGAQLDQLSDADLPKHLLACDVVARAVPAHKLRIVRAMQAHGEVVAMTGDGVNDAPALAAADIGIAMGQRGTDVAREASAIVIADDDFSAIVHALRAGRRIARNLKRAMAFVVAVHVPLAGLALLPVVLGWPLILLPAHIALLELLIDPACSVVFEMEPEDAQAMNAPPRGRQAALFDAPLLWGGLALGGLLLTCIVILLFWAQARSASESQIRSLGFGLLVLGDLALIAALLRPHAPLASLASSANPAWWVAAVATLVALAVMFGWPAAAALLKLAPASPLQALAGVAAVGLLVWPLRALARRLTPGAANSPGYPAR